MADGDLGLTKTIVDRADYINDTVSIVTSTTTPAIVPDDQRQGLHREMTTQTGTGSGSGWSHTVKPVTDGPETIHKEWIQAMQLVDLDLGLDKDSIMPNSHLSSVYFIRLDQTDMVKVGYSRDVKTRMQSLQTANPTRLQVLYQHQTSRHAELERCLHQLLHQRGLHIRGEWFTLPVDVDCHHLVSLATTTMV